MGLPGMFRDLQWQLRKAISWYLSRVKMLADNASFQSRGQGLACCLLQATAALQLALTEGYGRALRVHGQNVDALLGAGEVHLQIGRIARSGEQHLSYKLMTSGATRYQQLWFLFTWCQHACADQPQACQVGQSHQHIHPLALKNLSARSASIA